MRLAIGTLVIGIALAVAGSTSASEIVPTCPAVEPELETSCPARASRDGLRCVYASRTVPGHLDACGCVRGDRDPATTWECWDRATGERP